MNEFSRILDLYVELLNKVKLQEIQIESMREQIATLSETIQGQAPQQENQEAA
ncbi:hypothetical protein [Microbulbifer sp. THAF38]|uniref:hypothetical protein n=1 Tax=Microbulbifer sp. THAF38 TaxID=2587856 RepID=UPI001268D839|nr:hypothetical protein [Microbulbifer sp. THAF38]QFT53517.1 hypothetical protein FIU95_02890 [Microbulbifer sp. THAF38]